MAVKIEKTTIIGDVLDIAPQTAPLFMAIGMHCLGCPSSRGETVEEACAVHGIDVDKLLALMHSLRRSIASSKQAKQTRKTNKKREAAPPFFVKIMENI